MDKLELWNTCPELFYLDHKTFDIQGQPSEIEDLNLDRDCQEVVYKLENSPSIALESNRYYFDLQLETEYDPEITLGSLMKSEIYFLKKNAKQYNECIFGSYLESMLSITGEKIIHDHNKMLTIIPANIFKFIRNEYMYAKPNVSYLINIDICTYPKYWNFRLRLKYVSAYNQPQRTINGRYTWWCRHNIYNSEAYIPLILICNVRSFDEDVTLFCSRIIKIIYKVDNFTHEFRPDEIKKVVSDDNKIVNYYFNINRLKIDAVIDVVKNNLNLPSEMIHLPGDTKVDVDFEFTENSDLREYYIERKYFMYDPSIKQ